MTQEFFNDCHDAKDGRFCGWMVTRKSPRGILGKGTESYSSRQAMCGKGAGASGLCAVHEKEFARIAGINAKRRAEAAKKKVSGS